MTALPDSPETDRGWIVSVLFWLCLLIAAGMYGAVALAPKYLDYLELEAEHRAGQVQLAALSRRVGTLEKVAHALETDSAFVAELARIDLDAAIPGEERIAVAPEHRLDARPAVPVPAPGAATLPGHAPLVRAFAHDRGLRKTLLIGSAAIIIASFTLLHESPGGIGEVFRWIGRRYRRVPDQPDR